MADLIDRLEDQRPWVRDRATESLVLLGERAKSALEGLLRSSLPIHALEHAIWAWTRVEDQARLGGSSPPPTGEERSLLTQTADPDLAALTARALGRLGDPRFAPQLNAMLRHQAAHVRLAAAEALAHCGGHRSVEALIETLAGEVDRFQEHALQYALHRLASASQLEHALDHPHPRVQKAALQLLDQPPHRSLTSAAVLQRARASDKALRQTALRILRDHREWSGRALQVIRELASKERLEPEEQRGLIELILAFEFDDAVQRLVASQTAPNTLASSQPLLFLDVVERTSLAELPEDWVAALTRTIRIGSPQARLQAARLARSRRTPPLIQALRELAEQDGLPPQLRLEAVRAAIADTPVVQPSTFDFLLDQLKPENRPELRLSAADLLSRSHWPDAENDPRRLIELVREDRLISPGTLLPLMARARGHGATVAWTYLRESIRRGWEPAAAEWELMRAPAGSEQELTKLKEQAAARTQARRGRLDSYSELLTGGDPNRGHQLFLTRATCAVCHRIGREGGLLGPDLTKIGAVRSGRDLLESLVLPSASLAQGYEAYLVTLRDGESLTGIRVRDPSEAFVVRDASGIETRLRDEQIQSVDRLGLSLMPEGLVEALKPDELRDLLAFLQSLK